MVDHGSLLPTWYHVLFNCLSGVPGLRQVMFIILFVFYSSGLPGTKIGCFDHTRAWTWVPTRKSIHLTCYTDPCNTATWILYNVFRSSLEVRVKQVFAHYTFVRDHTGFCPYVEYRLDLT